jgi:hypothetical protein
MVENAGERAAVYLLVDTCVWLDLAAHYDNRPVLYVLEQVIGLDYALLLVPTIVLEEFERNRPRLVQEGVRGLSLALRRARDAAEKFGSKSRKRRVVDELAELDHRLVNLGDEVAEVMKRIEKLLKGGTVCELTDEIKVRAASRALDKKAPFHRGRNGMSDAILIETYASHVAEGRPGGRFAFVTHNVKDFSQIGGDARHPHPDLASLFSRVRSRYFTTLADALKCYWPQDAVDLANESLRIDLVPPRRIAAIAEVEEELNAKRWYDRFQMRADRVRKKEIKIVNSGENPPTYSDKAIDRFLWEREVAYAKRLEQKYGKKNLGPYTDFEWGMLAGKLSAIRWVMGDEWDELGTY